MTKTRILIAATDAELRGTLARWLMASGYGVELAESPRRAREVVATEPIALAIVAPGGLGEDLAGELGDLVGAVLIIQDSAGDETAAGAAEGLIVKPLRQDDVLARVKAALPPPASETTEAVPDEVLRFEGFVLDVGGRTCRDELGRDVPLKRAEFTLLVTLARQPGRVFARDQLRQAVSGRGGTGPDERSIDVLVSRVRRKIEADSKDPKIIVTVPGGGYKFTPTPQIGPPTQSGALAPRGAPADLQPPQPAAAAMSSTNDLPPPVAPQLSPVAGQSTFRGVLAAPGKVWAASAAACAGIAVIMAIIWTTTHQREASLNSAAKFDVAAIPMIGGVARRALSSYPEQPDVKAVAISGYAVGVAFGASSPEAAKAEALERCKARTDLSRSGPCAIYAIGMDVVWSQKSVPRPLPGDFHDESLGERLRAVDMPLWRDDARKKIDVEYIASGSHKALAMPAQNLAPAFWTVRLGADAEAIRRVVERCGHLNQVPCLLVSVDGMLTVQIPKSRRVTGVFLVTTEPQMSAAVRQRIDEIYRQKEWRALARGHSGAWYPVANSPSEDAAVAAALSACTQSDSDCRLYAIGNFRIADSD
jgi:two-component system, OmpR family, response regulator